MSAGTSPSVTQDRPSSTSWPVPSALMKSIRSSAIGALGGGTGALDGRADQRVGSVGEQAGDGDDDGDHGDGQDRDQRRNSGTARADGRRAYAIRGGWPGVDRSTGVQGTKEGP